MANENYMKKNIFLPIDKYKTFEGRVSKLLYFGLNFNYLNKALNFIEKTNKPFMSYPGSS